MPCLVTLTDLQWYFSSKNHFCFSYYIVLGNHFSIYLVLVFKTFLF